MSAPPIELDTRQCFSYLVLNRQGKRCGVLEQLQGHALTHPEKSTKDRR